MFDLDGSVLGIDPGLSRCGYGVVRLAAGRRAEAVACGVIRTPPSDPLPERLAALAIELERLMAEVKLAVTGDGAADKTQMQAMVARLLRLNAPPRPPDAADALALALCHLWRAPLSGAAAEPGGVGGAGGFERAVAAAVARGERA